MSDFEYEIVESDQIDFPTREKKKVTPLHFDGGTYLINSPHFRDGWTETDWYFYALLVRMKVRRDNRRGRVSVLDNIVEFRMLPSMFAEEFCDSLYSEGFKFVVYKDEE
jgi:hypothetical protein